MLYTCTILFHSLQVNLASCKVFVGTACCCWFAQSSEVYPLPLNCKVLIKRQVLQFMSANVSMPWLWDNDHVQQICCDAGGPVARHGSNRCGNLRRSGPFHAAGMRLFGRPKEAQRAGCYLDRKCSQSKIRTWCDVSSTSDAHVIFSYFHTFACRMRLAIQVQVFFQSFSYWQLLVAHRPDRQF